MEFIVAEDMLASKWKRFANHLVDLVPQYAITYGLAYVFFYIGEFTGNYTLNDFWNNLPVLVDYIFGYVLLVLYYFIFERATFRSLGKYVTNTKVIMTNGDEPTTKALLIRTLCRLIPFDALSFLGTNGKGWHDSISNTYVVDIAKFDSKRLVAEELEKLGQNTEIDVQV
ncbi:RDD family protein [Subsaxibacter sp. CAU 1640]|uniref:RDD family protein n=1 Tax=Subsaxibacter sp. CAU 1640 TaxID=2933271 RepID=UPI002004BCC4|nr:RDD family protein [Subsaxibacter sp. CAU 1640]MCK7589253.1 RDD family protein [Subsaxibacter sp. CAU 1640]